MANENRVVSIRVVPDTTGFRRELRDFLRGVEKSLSAKIQVLADTTQATAELTRVTSARDVLATLHAATAAASAEIDAATRDRVVDVDVDVDDEPLRDLDERVRKTRRALTDLDGGVRGTIRRAGGEVRSLAGAVSNLLQGVTGAAAGMVPLIAVSGLVSVAIGALPELLMATGGLLAGLPAVLLGVTAGVATLALGFNGMGEALGKALTKTKLTKDDLKGLSTNAAAVVKEVHKLRPAFKRLQQVVQQRLFAGLAKGIAPLARTWLPVLERTLGSVADTLNTVGRAFGKTLKDAEFVRDIERAFKNLNIFIREIGTTIAGPVLRAFGDLANAAGPILFVISDNIKEAATAFATWIDEAEKNGKLRKFFDDAARSIQKVIDIGKELVGIAKEIISAFMFEDNPEEGKQGFLDSTLEYLRKVRDYLKDEENRKNLREFADLLKELAKGALGLATAIGWAALKIGEFIRWFKESWKKFKEDWGADNDSMANSVVGTFGRIVTTIMGRVNLARTAVSTSWNQIRTATSAIFGQLPGIVSSSITRVVNTVRGLPARIRSAMPGVGTLLYSAGRQIIQGLLNGINAMIPRVLGALSSLTKKIPQVKGPISVDRKLLRPNARAIMDGLVTEFDAGAERAVDRLRRLTGEIGSVDIGLTGAALAGPQVVVARFGDRDLYGVVEDSIKDRPERFASLMQLANTRGNSRRR